MRSLNAGATKYSWRVKRLCEGLSVAEAYHAEQEDYILAVGMPNWQPKTTASVMLLKPKGKYDQVLF